MIYLIGGVARSGKTSIRKRLLNDYKISGLETDSLRTLFELSFPELGIHYQNPPMLNARRMAPFIESFIKSRFFFEDDFVLEGDCVTPDVAKKFGNDARVNSLFLGYPDISFEEKMRQLLEKPEGWVKDASRDDLQRKIKLFIDDSKIFKDLCAETNLPFIDVSDLRLDEVVAAALGTFHL
jgi:hypothetical protein